MGDAIGDAAAAIGSGISKSEALARGREEDNLRKDLLRAQIRATDARAANWVSEATSRTRISRIRDQTQRMLFDDQGRSYIAGQGTPAQEFADEFGDFLGELYGITRYRDLVRDARRKRKANEAIGDQFDVEDAFRRERNRVGRGQIPFRNLPPTY